MLNPDATLWGDAMAEKIALVPAPVVMQPSKYIQGKWKDGDFGRTAEVSCKAVHNGKDIAFRLEWAAATPKQSRDENTDFPDAAALLFPLTKNASLIMGSENGPVNIWYWRADRPQAAKSNIATGIGTSQVVEEKAIACAARHKDGRWSVVLTRAMTAGENAARFSAGSKVNIAFAVWEGANSERGGLKAFSPQWISATLDA
jgi:DMSO reductase family type II enzyme heme b subunit